ncbi:hypothetical protein Hanom_Chr07g00671011 [Helianthus anomalus]
MFGQVDVVLGHYLGCSNNLVVGFIFLFVFFNFTTTNGDSLNVKLISSIYTILTGGGPS